MCFVKSAKVNKMREKAMTYIEPKPFVEAHVFVDDIMAAGSRDVAEKVGKSLGSIGREKNTPL